MELHKAQGKFFELMSKLGEEGDEKTNFLLWVKETAEDILRERKHSNVDTMFEHIRDDIREALPLSATLPSEVVVFPHNSSNACAEPENTVHVDSFLFDDDEVDRLCDAGEMSRNYCTACGSHKVAPLSFISHSMSHIQLKYIFQHLVPNLHGRTLLDVGSRTGAVLYAGYLYSSASYIIGIEKNNDFCDLQQAMVTKYNMEDRIKVVCDDVCQQPQLVHQSDVIIMNNVFEFFTDTEMQTHIWLNLRKVITKPGTLLVLIPSLGAYLKPLQTGIIEEEWVKEIDVTQQRECAYKRLLFDSENENEDFDDIHLYSVI